MLKHLRVVVALVCVQVAVLTCAYGEPNHNASENWVATWATAQDLAPTVPDQPVLPPEIKRPNFSGRPRRNPPNIPKLINDQTVRMIVHTSIPGKKVRIELSNAYGKNPVLITNADVAIRKTESTIDPATSREVTFSGDKAVTIRPGQLIVSDPVDLDVAPLSDIAVSLHVTKSEGVPTSHVLGLHTGYLADGNEASAASMTSASTISSYFWLRSVDVVAPKDDFSVVCLGDSITDGAATTINTNSAWPALLAKRLDQKGSAKVAVVNEGISGNQVLRDGAGVSALARFDRDVISMPGVRWIILLEGINDINIHGQITGPGALTPQELIEGYRQIIERAHMYGIKVMGATLTPDKGIWLYGPVGEATRQAVNNWIRTGNDFDAVVDFDAAVRDKTDEAELQAGFNSGDHIHPNDGGNQAMADAVPVKYFSKP